MAIHFITGKPGGGKGLYGMKLIIDELRNGIRPIITNFALEIDPWVNGKGVAQKGLKAYLVQQYGQDFDCRNRIFRLPDEQIAEFFLYRAMATDTPGKFELARAKPEVKCDKEGNERIIAFDTSLLCQSGGQLILVDEAWKFWGSRNWQKTGDAVAFYNNQHRKVADDCLMMTQHTKQIDPIMYRVAQDFAVCRNRGLLRVGMFRQPDDFSVSFFENPPTGAAMEPMNTIKFKLDLDMAQCYDTTAGVGLTGRMAGDIGKKRKGLPFRSLVALAICLPLLTTLGFMWLLKRGTKAAIPTIERAKPVSSTNSDFTSRMTAPFFATLPPVTHALPEGRGRDSVEARPEIYMSGMMRWNGMWHVFLSDGRCLYEGDGEMTGLTRNACWIGTNCYRLKTFTQREMEQMPSYESSPRRSGKNFY